ncbi:type I-C CRISPR-associated protein Cas7/Csd2 [Alicyclobacillus mali (ex Roth et al. 2021)]|uniref:type I-C CRISPR-associated protein Cas7/Csd2 n=1 Tax=Alicyclobacillus mali (ex Roth et al. 2021) TaxID=1123961 RepID=UPI001A8DEE93|nr:type I-C CRISPR-associated protein Cas7/Csd2 [Alicyclobacillus mali (ex Roth et al. 2021)]
MNINDPKLRHDFVLLFDVQDGNPNGDPDAGNLPRTDPETMQGLVTDVAIKRKIRDYVSLVRSSNPKYQIYVKHRGILTHQQKQAYEALRIDSDPKKLSSRDVARVREWMCEHFYDVRMFGAVMSTSAYNAGQVRGAVQLTFARSYDPVEPQDISITRVALTNADDVKGGSSDDEEARSGQMGRKAFIPYGLFRSYGFVNPAFCEQTGVSEEDLALFWEALVNMWTIDRSAARGFMACRGLYVFTHEDRYGRVPAQELFELIQVHKKPGVTAPRRFGDYEVNVADSTPEGVVLTRIIG